MKVLVIGATGHTGTHLVNHLLEKDHDVTAFVRDPAKFKIQHPRLKIVQGDARDAASLDRAVQGQDAVMSALGPKAFAKDDLQEVFIRNLVAAMTKNNVKRLVNLSAMGAGDSKAGAPFVMRKIFIPLFLKNIFADKERGEVHLFGSALDYTNVRPGKLSNRPARGGVKASLRYDGLSTAISREDVANFMINQLSSSEWIRKSPLIGY